jgi:hypothetical protein
MPLCRLLTIFLAFAGGGWGLGEDFCLPAFLDKESAPTLNSKVSGWAAPTTQDEIGTVGVGDSCNSLKPGMCEMKLFKVCKESKKGWLQNV